MYIRQAMLAAFALSTATVSSITYAAPCQPDAINFNDKPWLEYVDQNIDNLIEVVEEGCSVFLGENTWAVSSSTYTITKNTVLEFGYQAKGEGEIHGIGFISTPNAVNESRIFNVFGSQGDFGIPGLDEKSRYRNAGEYERLSIPVGEYLSGEDLHLVLIMDQDTNVGASAYFDNLRLVEKGANDNKPQQLPLVKHPAPALKTAINGVQPNLYGFAVDIEGRNVAWRPGHNANMSDGLISQFSPWPGTEGAARLEQDPNLEFWCSNNQTQFHKADMPGVLAGSYRAAIPEACYDEFYYFFRYKMYGEVNDVEVDRWVYSGLFQYDEGQPANRIDPAQRETLVSHSANRMRFGHPHSRSGVQEAIFDATHNNLLISDLERYNTEIIDGPAGVDIVLDTAGSTVLRLEMLEWGAGECQGPQFVIGAQRAPYPIKPQHFNYGQAISFHTTFGSSNNAEFGEDSISSQVYNTFQHFTVGQGFTTSTGDPRLNPAGRASTRLVYAADDCNPSSADEKNAIFTQHLTSIPDKGTVNEFMLGHDLFHGLNDKYGSRPGDSGFLGAKGNDNCQDCHFRDGRGSKVVDTPRGKLLPPPVYGAGLLTWIEGREAGLRWDGSVDTIAQQVEASLTDFHGLEASALPEDELKQLVAYTEHLHVPVRSYGSYSDEAVAEGEEAFHAVGCHSCHQPTQKTRSDAPVAFRDLYIRPYTDMKLHAVNGGQFRTPPLWGLGRNIELLERNDKAVLFMHDGSASSIEEAILKHDGEAALSRDKFNALSEQQQSALKMFLKTL